MSASSSETIVAQLRHERRDMRRELARVRWWRQLIKARRDLCVAAMATPDGIGGLDMDSAWEALAADAPTFAELSAAVWPHGTTATAEIIAQLDSLDSRLEHYEARVADNLEAVTTHMVMAMGGTERSANARERDFA